MMQRIVITGAGGRVVEVSGPPSGDRLDNHTSLD